MGKTHVLNFDADNKRIKSLSFFRFIILQGWGAPTGGN